MGSNSLEESTETFDQVEDDNTTTNDEAQETDDTDLEDTDISFDDVDDDEDDDEETDESEDSEDDEAVTDSPKDEAEDSDGDVQDEKSKEEDTLSADEQKRANYEAAQRRIAEREQLKAKQQEDYLNGAEDARDLAVRQLQIDAYNNRVVSNHSSLESGMDRAVANIDIFSKGSDVEKSELVDALDDFEHRFVTRDQNGDVIDIKVDPVTGQKADVYQFLQKKADSIRRLTGVGARTETKAKNKTKSRTDTLPSRAPKEPKKDADLEGFDEEANRY